jgi:hypothetical protein
MIQLRACRAQGREDTVVAVFASQS